MSATEPVAYSYIRFSHPAQAAGDSLRRQTEAAADWCRRNRIRLDTSTTFRDLGKSAFLGDHRKNPDRHALARFLALVENEQKRRIPRGSYLIIENLDRLSREHIRPALTLLLNLIEAGIRIVQLKPVEMVFDEQVDPMQLMMAIMELSRGHSESAVKSFRVGEAWGQRRRRARSREGVLTRRLPAWVEERGGRLHLIPERAAVVRRIFDLAGSGYGLYSIMRRFTEEKVPSFGPSGHWSVSYLWLIVTDRRAVGEYQPCILRGGRSQPDGEPIPDYFPRVVSDESWERARLGVRERYRRPGRVTAEVNVFAGLLKSARDGSTYAAAMGTGRGKTYRVLLSTGPRSGRGKPYAFPLATFEAAVLSCLREIDPHEILNGDDGPDETLALAGQLAGVEARIGELEAELLKGEVAAVVRVLRQLEERKRALAEELAEARLKAANPLSEAWGEAHSLLEAIGQAADPKDARLRLRSALRQIIDSIWLLVVPRGRDRLCAVQIWFADGKRHRDYLILHRPPKANKAARVEGGWWARSLASTVKAGDLDLRKRDHAKRLEKALAGAVLGDAGG
jgi:DNA invertase Pin-like site-specific DNA recombinase